MPIHRYGCVTGRFVGVTRENPKPGKQGKYHHGQLKVAAAGTYECAIDGSAPEGKPLLFSVVDPLSTAFFAPARALAPGVHALASASGSGALDYVRAAALKVKGWKKSSGDSIFELLEGYGRRSLRVWVFGDRNAEDTGANGVHMNQGHPAGAVRHPANGAWQDGGIVFELTGSRFLAVLTRIDDQTLATDVSGNPA